MLWLGEMLTILLSDVARCCVSTTLCDMYEQIIDSEYETYYGNSFYIYIDDRISLLYVQIFKTVLALRCTRVTVHCMAEKKKCASRDGMIKGFMMLLRNSTE